MKTTLKSRFPQIIRSAEQTVRQVNQRTARAIAEDATARAPRGASGKLADSIDAKPGDGDDWLVTVGEFYGLFVEYGTRRAGARPFLTPAAEAHRAAHRKALRDLYQ